jgi:hypothetical protein
MFTIIAFAVGGPPAERDEHLDEHGGDVDPVTI